MTKERMAQIRQEGLTALNSTDIDLKESYRRTHNEGQTCGLAEVFGHNSDQETPNEETKMLRSYSYSYKDCLEAPIMERIR